MIKFIIGAMLGSTVTVMFMCCFMIARYWE